METYPYIILIRGGMAMNLVTKRYVTLRFSQETSKRHLDVDARNMLRSYPRQKVCLRSRWLSKAAY
jgi:hypothetical protein